MANLKSKSKKELEALGREYGIELDRRLTKAKLIEELEAHITTCGCGNTQDENGACDGSHAKTTSNLFDPSGSKLGWTERYLSQDGVIVEFTEKGKAKHFAHRKGGKVVSTDSGNFKVRKS